jgi:Catalytic LigB subunit of aromatic ring-opening dioxygenase
MARIVLGLATSHGPMLTTPPENWDQRVNFDRRYPEHAFKGKTYNFEQLVKLRAGEGLDKQITKAKWAERHAQCMSAIGRLADVFAAAKPDVAVIFGNDQKELFNDAAFPALAVYWGETIENRMGPEELKHNEAPGVAVAQAGRIPPEGATYPGQPQLGRAIIEKLMATGHDVTSVKQYRPGRGAIPHAYGFVYRKIMRDTVVPNVPVILNTFYPPNQPDVRRCWDIGRTVLEAVQAWPSDLRVALIASGGLTHFVIDEDVDNAVLDAIRAGKVDELAALGEPIFQEGTSEIKNWIALMGAMAELKYKPTIEDYVPCYRSLAGTGNAMGFVHWHG